jgi:hypothetical protein
MEIEMEAVGGPASSAARTCSTTSSVDGSSSIDSSQQTRRVQWGARTGLPSEEQMLMIEHELVDARVTAVATIWNAAYALGSGLGPVVGGMLVHLMLFEGACDMLSEGCFVVAGLYLLTTLTCCR